MTCRIGHPSAISPLVLRVPAPRLDTHRLIPRTHFPPLVSIVLFFDLLLPSLVPSPIALIRPHSCRTIACPDLSLCFSCPPIFTFLSTHTTHVVVALPSTWTLAEAPLTSHLPMFYNRVSFRAFFLFLLVLIQRSIRCIIVPYRQYILPYPRESDEEDEDEYRTMAVPSWVSSVLARAGATRPARGDPCAIQRLDESISP